VGPAFVLELINTEVHNFQRYDVKKFVAQFLFMLGGLMNALVYVLLNRRTQRLLTKAALENQRNSCQAERRLDPLLGGRAVTFEQMVREHQGLDDSSGSSRSSEDIAHEHQELDEHMVRGQQALGNSINYALYWESLPVDVTPSTTANASAVSITDAAQSYSFSVSFGIKEVHAVSSDRVDRLERIAALERIMALQTMEHVLSCLDSPSRISARESLSWTSATTVMDHESFLASQAHSETASQVGDGKEDNQEDSQLGKDDFIDEEKAIRMSPFLSQARV